MYVFFEETSRRACHGKARERLYKFARSGDRAYRNQRFWSVPVGRVPSRGAMVKF